MSKSNSDSTLNTIANIHQSLSLEELRKENRALSQQLENISKVIQDQTNAEREKVTIANLTYVAEKVTDYLASMSNNVVKYVILLELSPFYRVDLVQAMKKTDVLQNKRIIDYCISCYESAIYNVRRQNNALISQVEKHIDKTTDDEIQQERQSEYLALARKDKTSNNWMAAFGILFLLWLISLVPYWGPSSVSWFLGISSLVCLIVSMNYQPRELSQEDDYDAEEKWNEIQNFKKGASTLHKEIDQRLENKAGKVKTSRVLSELKLKVDSDAYKDSMREISNHFQKFLM